MLKGLPENGLYAPVALLYLDRLRRTQTRTRVARLWGGRGTEVVGTKRKRRNWEWTNDKLRKRKEVLTGSLQEVWEITALSLSEKLQHDPVRLYYDKNITGEGQRTNQHGHKCLKFYTALHSYPTVYTCSKKQHLCALQHPKNEFLATRSRHTVCVCVYRSHTTVRQSCLRQHNFSIHIETSTT